MASALTISLAVLMLAVSVSAMSIQGQREKTFEEDFRQQLLNRLVEAAGHPDKMTAEVEREPELGIVRKD